VRTAVVGHVEWVEFARVDAVPRPGEIAHAIDLWQEPAGGGGLAAVVLGRLAGDVTLFTALGDDELGHRAKTELERLGVRVEVAWREAPQRRAIVFVDPSGERTITTLGLRLEPSVLDALPWEELSGADAVYFTAGGVEAIRRARSAKVLVATAREVAVVARAAVELDALVGSGSDERERYESGDLDPPPRVVVTTAGPLGGWLRPGGPFQAVAPDGPIEDTYGAGDSFAAGLTYGLGCGWSPQLAVETASACGAEALTRRGAHGEV
jgi:ribokinase